jgi:multiple antibiotic resistance protein
VNATDFVNSAILMLVLLNPLLMSTYLIDVIKGLNAKVFTRVLVRAFVISGGVFFLFAWVGEAIFTRMLQVRFEAFLIFGGLVFLIIAIRYMINGANVIDTLRGPPEHLAGSIAMPFMIGPGTVSASVLIGARLPILFAALAIIVALVTSCLLLIVFKLLHDWAKERNEALVERYVEIAGRVSALLIGTIAVEMVFRGVESWLQGLGWPR